jgi:VIT1/CCC1 family predicted Fe2+/Mn2+ transporter
MLDEKIKEKILGFQRNEITEHNIYKNIAERTKGSNAKVLNKISQDELRHYNEWKRFTNIDVKPSGFMSLKFQFISLILGLTFATKMMERGEGNAQKVYAEIVSVVPEAKQILEDETVHEKNLIAMIDEEKIAYIGSMVLGINDALVELTGALTGLTFTFQNAKLIGVAGLISGIAAALSMAGSEYLSQKSEKGKSPLKASFYTGIVYITTVLLLVTPFFLLSSYYFALGTTIVIGASIVLLFTFFLSVVKELPFKRLFLEMLSISLGVAAISFIIGWAARGILSVEI